MAQNVEAWTLLALALVVIIIRIYVRWSLVGPKGFQLDDYLMPLAGIVFVLETVAAYLVGANYEGLTNSYISPSERQAIVPNSKEWNNRVAGSKIQVLGWSLYVAILWLVKFALAVFYSRLTTGLQNLPQRVRIAYVILGITWLATQLSLLLSCQPFHAFWQINPDPGDVCQPAKSPVYVLVVVLLNIVTDLYLLSIPLPLLWQVKISLKQKIPLMGLFSGAAFVITASIIRAVMISVAGPEGAVAGSKWACRETFVSIVVSNLPIIQPLIRRGFKKIGLSQLFSSSGKESNGRSYPLSGRGRQTLASHADRITKKGKHAQGLTQTQVSAWGSDEHILTSPEPTSKEITVVSETIVQTEQWNRDRAPQPTRVSSPNQWDARGTTHAM